MKTSLYCFGICFVFLLSAPSTLSFSHGANHASCQDMTPGHIRAQPQDLHRSHVTLHTSASLYMPGQLITVTVRSSRDFMGFLLQARSVEAAGESGAVAKVGTRARTGIGARVRSIRVGPVLMGGSWTLTPPGTHTLHCLSEGDTLTHSDKQLKKNLSFVWRAPDRPVGDIRFYITVVQSYFVYWAGIESAVVHDGSRSSWSGRNTALRAHTVSFIQTSNKITSPPTTASFSKPTRLNTLQSSSSSPTHALPLTSISSTTPLYPSGGSTQVSMRPSFRSKLLTHSAFSFTRNQPKTAPALSALPSPSPISIPPHSLPTYPSSIPPIPSSITSSIPSSSSSNYPSSAPFFSPVHISTFSPFESPQSQSTTFSLPSSSTNFPALFSSPSFSIDSSTSSISSTSSPPSPPSSSTPTFTSNSASSLSLGSSSSSMSSQSTSPHPGPSPAPRRYNPLTSSSLLFPSQKFTLGQRFLIQNPPASSDPEPNLNPPTLSTVVHPNPVPHPNLNPNFIQNAEHDFKPNPPKTDTKSKRPSHPTGTPDKEGKYPNIISRHSAWEVGMLLGCSAGLGMVLVVGIRYIYRQACGKRTEVTLNDREREYGRGERGLIHVQECGDLVKVRRFRENSFVLLAEYDILASPGD
ncbi:hypothetical protein PAMP_016007 [Pampus punctatissimus]